MSRQIINTERLPPPSARTRRPCAPATPCISPARSRSTRPPATSSAPVTSKQARRAFDNLKAVAEAAGGSLDKVVRLGLYLTDLGEFAKVNAVMQDYFQAPYPARSTIEVSGLPKGASFEVDAVMVID